MSHCREQKQPSTLNLIFFLSVSAVETESARDAPSASLTATSAAAICMLPMFEIPTQGSARQELEASG